MGLRGVIGTYYQGQPTQQIIEHRRRAQFITPIPKPKKRKGLASQQQIIFDEGKGLSTQKQQYDINAIINRVRQEVGQWRSLPTPAQVTPETARLLEHWRHRNLILFARFFVRSSVLYSYLANGGCSAFCRRQKHTGEPCFSEPRRQPRTPAARAEARHWRGQDYGHGHAYCLANC